MTFTVNIAPELQAELERRAKDSGTSVEAYAASLLEEALQLPAHRLRKAQIETTFREMAQFSHKIPVLPDSAFTRDSLYPDHDGRWMHGSSKPKSPRL